MVVGTVAVVVVDNAVVGCIAVDIVVVVVVGVVHCTVVELVVGHRVVVEVGTAVVGVGTVVVNTVGVQHRNRLGEYLLVRSLAVVVADSSCCFLVYDRDIE